MFVILFLLKAGQLMPSYLVYPERRQNGYICNPLNGSTEGSQIAYTHKGWIYRSKFEKFKPFLQTCWN